MVDVIIKPNKMQQKCIDNINGKYLVLAGPGTGKTFTIIQRIKEMILRGIAPEKILCLTFTEVSVVNSLWVGLFSFLGADTLYKSLEGKLASFKDIVNKREEVVVIPRGDE